MLRPPSLPLLAPPPPALRRAGAARAEEAPRPDPSARAATARRRARAAGARRGRDGVRSIGSGTLSDGICGARPLPEERLSRPVQSLHRRPDLSSVRRPRRLMNRCML
ncbi:hypothetical protein SB2_30545 [Methylobacterium radiotolerans]|nr:hypothetical protein SB2_30545 [Methylobacterium radiotolerans]